MRTRAKIISVVGARPQFIKLAPLAGALRRRFVHKIVHTGQHFDFNMSDIFFRYLKIPKTHANLQINGDTNGEMTGRMLAGLSGYFKKEKPDMVLVYGDTNSTLAGALAAAQRQIPVGHIEAGMRSFVPDMPEEINRRLTDHISTLLFCPTPTARKNLLNENIKQRIVIVGDLMYELLAGSQKMITENTVWLRRNNLEEKKYIYLTAHRAANVDTDENLKKIIAIIRVIDEPVLFPVHPRTEKRLRTFRLWRELTRLKNIRPVEPLGYRDNLTAVNFARLVLTDSGGLQKEALFLGTPVLTLRNETEWVETLKRGNYLVGLNIDKIKKQLKAKHRVRKIDFRVRRQAPSRLITDALARFFREC
ncbi:MAG: non-hydrolyzing UDP-N-acetylglucosamine 2-epimerase [Candidatus Zixiibacteriota bacterium]